MMVNHANPLKNVLIFFILLFCYYQFLIRCKGTTFSGTEQINLACLYEVAGFLYENRKPRRVISTGRGTQLKT